MFLTGTLLNVATVLVGTLVGLLVGARMPARMQTSLTTGLGLFVVLIGLSMGLRIFTDPAAQPGDDLAVMAAVLIGVAIGEVLRLHDGLEWLGGWFQRRLAGDNPVRPSRIAEGFVTASLVFCVGPLTVLGSVQDGLRGDHELLFVKAGLDGVVALILASTLGAGVGLSAAVIAVFQGGLTALAAVADRLLTDRMVLEMTATGGVMLLGIGLRVLDIRAVRVGSFLPALVIAPVAVGLFAR